MLERFTDPARATVVDATAEARRLGHDSVGPEHLLVALAGDQRGTAGQALMSSGLDQQRLRSALIRRRPMGAGLGPDDGEALASIGVDLEAVRERIEANFGEGALSGQASRRRPRFSKEAKKSLELALREAIWMKNGAQLESANGPLDERDLRASSGRLTRGRLNINGIGTEHLLLGVIRGGGTACSVLLDLHVQPMDLRSALLRTIADAA